MIRAAFNTAVLIGAVLVASVVAAQPPKEPGSFRPPDLVEILKLDKTIKLDIRYATKNNFLGRPVYKQARAFLQRPAAEALVRVHQALKAQGFGLMVFDGYRPWSVTKVFWDNTPNDKKSYVADPAVGSRHNRGCAVDLTLFDLKTGRAVTMPSEYDEMTERSHADHAGATPEATRLRDLLIAAMQAQGFTVFATEWWHFDYKDWKDYAILDIPFKEIGK